MVKVGHSCSSAHQTSRHSAVRCHWLHGSSEGGTQKATQRHVVTVRCVYGHFFFHPFQICVDHYYNEVFNY